MLRSLVWTLWINWSVPTASVERLRRWPMAFFYDMIDISALNAYIIWTELNPGWNNKTSRRRSAFLKELGRDLVKPFVESTRSKIPNLSLSVKRTIVTMIGKEKPFEQNEIPGKSKSSLSSAEKKKHCVHCPVRQS
ncbi:hypothetical protein BV898_05139 [Hypsibius exemplaris]|uniref:PiggyBac transposable element-derived protein domain-containing protein n=1 Tax=Hypsibius exemplaris TaxID=2072580 RepID=A0A1W0X023_HYPEX|nr:hypothetical protein BV898_05139 [Hypsibius exemplaris]